MDRGKPSLSKQHKRVEYFSVAGLTSYMSPIGLHVYGVNFLDAAKLAPMTNTQFGPARFFLVCHALELFLKAFLSIKSPKKERSLESLADGFGHNLAKLLGKARKLDLETIVHLDEHQIYHIERASEYYVEKVFEYPALDEAVHAYPRTPSIQPLLDAAEALASGLREMCLKC